MIWSCICVSLLCSYVALILLMLRVRRLESWCDRVAQMSSSISKSSGNV